MFDCAAVNETAAVGRQRLYCGAGSSKGATMQQMEPLESRKLLASFTATSVADLIGDINAANAAGGANTITLAAGGSFKLVAVDNTTNGPTGLPVIAAGNDLAIVGNGATIERSSAKGTPAFRIFDVASGGSLSLNNLKVSNGTALHNSFDGAATGGGVRSLGTLSLSRVTVQNCVARGNQNFVPSALGGGVYSGGVLDVADSAIQNNQALGPDGPLLSLPWPGGPAAGGGLYVAGGTAALSNTTLSSNLARGGNGANAPTPHKGTGFPPPAVGGKGGDALGGGLYAAAGTVTLRDCTVTRNAATGGTGGTSAGNLPRAANGTGQGGGIYIAPAAAVGLDSFTQLNTRSNTASTSNNDMFGSFTILV
jgi:hypothetical protein